MNHDPNATEPSTHPADTSAEGPAPPRRASRKKRRGGDYRHVERPAAPLIQTLEEGAQTLRTTAEALRARLRRHQVIGVDGSVTSPIASGITGIKIGAHWRVKFENAK